MGTEDTLACRAYIHAGHVMTALIQICIKILLGELNCVLCNILH